MTYTENSKCATKNLELINEFSKFADYKDNTQNPVTILHTNRKLSESKIKKILIAVTTKRISVSKLIKEVKGLSTETYKTFMMKIKEDTNKWKDNLCSWICRINTVKIFILSKSIYRFKAISIKIPMTFFI